MEFSLPLNYVELDQDEMMYLDGGWSSNVLGQNLMGMAQKSIAVMATVRTIAKSFGLETVLLNGLKATYASVVSKANYLIAQAVTMIGGIGFGLATLALTLGAVWVLGEFRIFY